ncbi:hypothetical protein VPH35_048818 [Triticum aestivum]|uniref:Acetyltransferase n=1 Tax=Triticum aestivum TaxID=4565 RepID=D8L9U4_WHEAT|nr:unnamed protein product [Triticum aestivum]CDM80662.1 unnamed protein product [Triticum aestivum]
MVLSEPTPWLPSEPETTIDLTPWDLRMITVDMEGAEFVHAVAPGVTVADVVAPLSTPGGGPDCFLHFSAESVKKLKAKANAEASGTGTATISSLQALLAHLWVAVCRARRLAPDQSTTYVLLLDPGAACTAYRWATRATPWHAPRRRPRLASWARNLTFACTSAPPPALVVTGNSPRFDVYGNDFGWGQPVAVRRSSANKMDGTATVFQGRGGGGSMALQVCLAPEVLARRVTDDEFMSAVTA